MKRIEEAKAQEEALKLQAEKAGLVTKLIAAKDGEATAQNALADAKTEAERKAAKEAVEVAQVAVRTIGEAIVAHNRKIEDTAELNLVCAGGSAPKGYFSNLLTAIF